MNCSNAGCVSSPRSLIASSWLSSANMSFMRCMSSGDTFCIAPDIWLK